jgi:GNAT superfamily N-acetyltransferase
MWGLVEVAEMQGNPIGLVSAEKLPNPAYGVLLDCLHVLAPFQGHGAGKLLIDAARAWARQLGEKQMHLYTLEGNARAIAFYERNGWQRAGSVDGYIGETPVTDRRYVIAP